MRIVVHWKMSCCVRKGRELAIVRLIVLGASQRGHVTSNSMVRMTDVDRVWIGSPCH
jgi:hypothetical protein